MAEVKTETVNEIIKISKTFFYATGKRKNSIAKVWLLPDGVGKIQVNKKDSNKYFSRSLLNSLIKQPFDVIKNVNFNAVISVKGGGLTGQAGAIKLAISRALIKCDPKFRPSLKEKGLLTRDSRVVERKKYGRKKARRSFQFSKR